jgi:hypothetical protein
MAAASGSSKKVSKTGAKAGTEADDSMVMRFTWERLSYEKKQRPSKRNSHSMACMEHLVFVFGGRAKGGESSDLLVFNMLEKEDGWQAVTCGGDKPCGRKSAPLTPVPSQGKLYLFGGCRDSNIVLNDLYSYDVASREWENERSSDDSSEELLALDDGGVKEESEWIDDGTMPCPRDRHSMIEMKNRLIVFGGHHSKTREYLNDVWIYDIEGKTWRCAFGGSYADADGDAKEVDEITSCPLPRYEHTAVAVDERYMVIIGGKCARHGLRDVHIFDVETERWVSSDFGLRKFPREACWGQSAVVYHSRIIIFGGWNGRSCFNDIHIIDCTKKPWTYLDFSTLGERPSMRTFHGAAIPIYEETIGEEGTDDDGESPRDGKKAKEKDASKATKNSHLMILMGGRDLKKRLDDTYTLDIAHLDPAVFAKRRRRSLAVTDDFTGSLAVAKPESVLNDDFKAAMQAYKRTLKEKTEGIADEAAVRDAKRSLISVGHFDLSTTLGTGSFGRVRLSKYKKTGDWFALKMLRKTKVVEMKQENHIKWEKRILSSIRHPFIVNMEAYFQDKFFLYLVLELVPGGEFFSLLRRIRTLRMPHAVFYSAQIVLVFQYLHKNKIIYRDLKPENLLIASDGYLRLTDFGFAKRLEPPYKTWTLCGTPEYIAPEILLNRGHSFSVDWWALGILLFEMFTGNPPFVDENPMRIYQKILDGRITYPARMNPNAKDFIGRLLAKNLSTRLGHTASGAMDVMEHPFFDVVDWKRILDKRVKSPYKPELKDISDTRHFDKYDEVSDTEDVELDADPFVAEF